MTYFLATATFPPHKATEVGKTFPNLPKLPDFVKQLFIFVVPSSDIKAYSLFEVPDDKAHEGYVAMTKRYTGYFGIEGYKFTIELLLTAKDALALIGLG
ncbi:MAG: hypothetical protein CEE42_15800 [Promethearchaeota archaeon Loki_b31]|nr:MAG: hypothetical protein CEE42_15800 [Candidatus Lokiarchaeota archaeon Loki_b31]